MLRLKSEASGKDSENLLYAVETGVELSPTVHRVQHEQGDQLLEIAQSIELS
jgi:hypothetical protein